MLETLAELPFIGDQVVCLSQDQGAARMIKIITIFQWILILSSPSITDADRDRGRKLARLQRGFCSSEPAKKSGQNIPKNRCRTTIAEQMMETLAELPFIGDQVVCLSHEPGRPQRNAIKRRLRRIAG